MTKLLLFVKVIILALLWNFDQFQHTKDSLKKSRGFRIDQSCRSPQSLQINWSMACKR